MDKKKPSVSFPYTVVARKVTKTRTYQLLKFQLPKMSSEFRRRMFSRILIETNALGLIEWWVKGSIINKPQSHFYAILVFEAAPST